MPGARGPPPGWHHTPSAVPVLAQSIDDTDVQHQVHVHIRIGVVFFHVQSFLTSVYVPVHVPWVITGHIFAV